MKNVLVIGSGIGGSGIGALIAANSKNRVIIVEQNPWLGGRCGSYTKEDAMGREWVCDVGTHIFGNCDKGSLGEILTKIGKENAVEWAYCKNPGPRINFMGQVMSFGLKETGGDSEQQTGNRESRKKTFKGILQEMSYEDTYKYDEMPLIDFLEQNNLNAFMYTLQAGLMYGTGPQTTSAGEFLRCSKKNAENMSMGYVKGGCQSIPLAYCQAIEEHGGEVITGTRVSKIVIEDGVVQGVMAGPDNEFLPADIVISNSDIKTTVMNLAGEEFFPQDYVQRVKNLSWGGRVCSLKLGIDIHVTDEKWLNYVPVMDVEDLKSIDFSNAEKIELTAADVPSKCVIMIVPISNLDPDLAPPGCQNLHCVTPTLGIPRNIKERAKINEKWKRCCMNTLLDLWPQLEGHILWTDFVSDMFLETRLGKEGAGTGIGQVIGQVGKSRPSVATPVKNLYLVGGDAGGWGVGTELAANSALELFDYLQSEKII
ncbi:MAG: FAD-dependent oxidoreductase [Smithella sp.]